MVPIPPVVFGRCFELVIIIIIIITMILLFIIIIVTHNDNIDTRTRVHQSLIL